MIEQYEGEAMTVGALFHRDFQKSLLALLYCFWEGYATTLGMLFRLRDPPKSTAGDRARERSGRSTPKNP